MLHSIQNDSWIKIHLATIMLATMAAVYTFTSPDDPHHPQNPIIRAANTGLYIALAGFGGLNLAHRINEISDALLAEAQRLATPLNNAGIWTTRNTHPFRTTATRHDRTTGNPSQTR